MDFQQGCGRRDPPFLELFHSRGHASASKVFHADPRCAAGARDVNSAYVRQGQAAGRLARDAAADLFHDEPLTEHSAQAGNRVVSPLVKLVAIVLKHLHCSIKVQAQPVGADCIDEFCDLLRLPRDRLSEADVAQEQDIRRHLTNPIRVGHTRVFEHRALAPQRKADPLLRRHRRELLVQILRAGRPAGHRANQEWRGQRATEYLHREVNVLRRKAWHGLVNELNMLKPGPLLPKLHLLLQADRQVLVLASQGRHSIRHPSGAMGTRMVSTAHSAGRTY